VDGVLLEETQEGVVVDAVGGFVKGQLGDLLDCRAVFLDVLLFEHTDEIYLVHPSCVFLKSISLIPRSRRIAILLKQLPQKPIILPQYNRYSTLIPHLFPLQIHLPHLLSLLNNLLINLTILKQHLRCYVFLLCAALCDIPLLELFFYLLFEDLFFAVDLLLLEEFFTDLLLFLLADSIDLLEDFGVGGLATAGAFAADGCGMWLAFLLAVGGGGLWWVV
jgi:hypothetical protein